MKKYICLRDDDTSYFTQSETLKTNYHGIIGNLPITLATVPFIQGSSLIMSELDPAHGNLIDKSGSNIPELQKAQYASLRKYKEVSTVDQITDFFRIYPISDNQNLIDMLKPLVKSGLVEIAQHGVYHKYCEFGPEMLQSRISYQQIKDGKDYLEKVFNTRINTFVPPSNTIDEITAHFVNQIGMAIYTCGGIYYKNIANKLLSYILHPLSFYKLLLRKLRISEKPFRYISNIFIFGSITYDRYKDKNDINEKLEENLKKFGFASLGTHYNILDDQDYRAKYFELIGRLADKGAEFVLARDYYRLMRETYE